MSLFKKTLNVLCPSVRSSKQRSLFGLLSISCGSCISLFSMLPAQAEPAAVFAPYLSQLLEKAPGAIQIRLPSAIFSGDGTEPKEWTVNVVPSRSLSLLSISLSHCQQGAAPCLVGTITMEPQTSPNGQREFQRHQAGFTPITLAPNVQGYFLEGTRQQPPISFSSVMWQQDTTFYNVTFPAQERQNLLFTAHSMAVSLPLLSASPDSASPISTPSTPSP